MDRGAWWATVQGVTQSQTGQSDSHFIHMLHGKALCIWPGAGREATHGASEPLSARGCLAHTCMSRESSMHLQALVGPGSASRQEGSGLPFKSKQRQAGAGQVPQAEGRRGCRGQTRQAPRPALSRCGPQVCRLLAWASFTCQQGPCRTRVGASIIPTDKQGNKLRESK